jgi:putative transcriptional regulator
MGCALQFNLLSCAPPRQPMVAMIRCHLSSLMGRDKLNISDVARATGLNRSTVTALYRETATRIELPAIERLCALFKCNVGDLLEVVPDSDKGTP